MSLRAWHHQAFFWLFFSKLKVGKTQRFSKLKLLLGKSQGKYSKTQYFGNFCRFKYSQWSNNYVILTISLHNIKCIAFTSQSFCICEFETQQKLNFFQKLKIFLVETQGNFSSKLNIFCKTQFFGNSILLRWRQNGQKKSLY